MVSIKDIIILFIEISSFILKTPYKRKVNKDTKYSPRLVAKTYRKKKQRSKENTQDTSQVIVKFSLLCVFFQDLHRFSKRQSEMATFNG